MTVSNIILRVLKKVVGVLEKEKIDYCLFGGLAMQVYKRIRATKDVDLIVSVASERIPELFNKLEKQNFKFDSKRGVIKINIFELMRFSHIDEDTGLEIFIDLVTGTTEFFKKIFNRKIKTEFLSMEVNVASLEDIILLKLLADRPIDVVDTQDLLEENINSIDKNYINSWAKKLNVQSKLQGLLKNIERVNKNCC